VKFIEMTGRQLAEAVRDDEINAANLVSLGIKDDHVFRINQQGDIEWRKPAGWDIIGGLIGDFENRVKRATGLDWA
jgi:hypothetical protein